MTANGWLQFIAFCAVLLALVRPVGIYLAHVLEGERTWLDPLLRPIEGLIYKLSGVDTDREMSWREYAVALLGFSAVSLILTYILERAQGWSILAVSWLNPQKLPAVEQALAWSTAASFTTN